MPLSLSLENGTSIFFEKSASTLFHKASRGREKDLGAQAAAQILAQVPRLQRMKITSIKYPHLSISPKFIKCVSGSC